MFGYGRGSYCGYNRSMSRLIDSIAVWLVCLVFAVLVGPGEVHVAAALASWIALCLCQASPWVVVRVAMLVAYLVACACWAPLFAFLPLGACLCVSERSWFLRAAWAPAWLAVAIQQGSMNAVLLLVLCGVGAILAWDTSLDRAARARMRLSRDEVREQMLSLAERARSIQLELEGRSAGAGEATGAEAEAFDPFEGLTERERQVAVLVAEGMDNRAIAESLYLSEGTIRNNISAILQKKQLKNRTQLAVLCLSRG